MHSSAEEAQIVTRFQYFDIAKHSRCNKFDILHVYEREDNETHVWWNNVSDYEKKKLVYGWKHG